MTAYARAGDQVTLQRCAYGDDHRGYCGAVAVEHVWVRHDEHTVACPVHVVWFDRRPYIDRHPVGAMCALPGTTWVHSSRGRPGLCRIDGLEHVEAVTVELACP